MLDSHVRSVKLAVLVAGVEVAPDLEGVVVKVVVLPKVVVDRKTSLAHLFAWTASGGVVVLPAAALLAALGPQLTPCWAALVRLVAPVAAPLAALGLQQTPAGAALVALMTPATAPLVAAGGGAVLGGIEAS